MKKLFVALFVFTATGLFADMDPQRFFSALNLRLGISTYATIRNDDGSGQLSVADAREADENNDGYVFFVDSPSFSTHQFSIINVNTRQVVTFFLSNDPDFPQLARNQNLKDYGNIFSYSNLKEAFLKDCEVALQRLGMRTKRTRDSIQGFAN